MELVCLYDGIIGSREKRETLFFFFINPTSVPRNRSMRAAPQ